MQSIVESRFFLRIRPDEVDFEVCLLVDGGSVRDLWAHWRNVNRLGRWGG